jgi:phage FluMu protein Com
MLHCSECNRILMDKTPEGWKLRTRMVLFTPSGATALCPSCKTPNPIPVEMNGEPSAVPRPKFVVKAQK